MGFYTFLPDAFGPSGWGGRQAGFAPRLLTASPRFSPSLPAAVCCTLEYRPCAAGEHGVGNSPALALPRYAQIQGFMPFSPREHPLPSILAIYNILRNVDKIITDLPCSNEFVSLVTHANQHKISCN